MSDQTTSYSLPSSQPDLNPLSGSPQFQEQKWGKGNPLPAGTITFLFTDIEGSTPLWEQYPQEMAEALQVHNAALRQAIEANGGVVFKTVGDAFQAAFPTAPQALKATIEGQRALLAAPWNELGTLKVRMGLHTGEAELDPGGDEYTISHTKNRIGRIHSAAHGGQILLSQETTELVARQLPEGVSLKNLGEHHLKGLQWPEHLFQVCTPGLPQDYPPLATAITRPNNLPQQMTSFIGREKEIAAVCHLLMDHRLVTLTGVGGVGKTRLALAVAGEMLGEDPPGEDPPGEFEHGAWLVELAPLGEPQLIPQAVATVFGLRPGPGQTVLNILLDYLRAKHLLLILDNCEHLIGAGAELAETILRSCPRIHLLASSREALGIDGEMPYTVPSLALPDPHSLPPLHSLPDYEAVQLFIERAQAAAPGFTINEANAAGLVRICQRVDGIPLALELAAARLHVLSVEQIASRLEADFRLLTGGSRRALPRHQTLQALIGWSYGLLTDEEKDVFRRLSVFSGGWTLEAAEAVCERDVLDALAQLVNKSLVVVQRQSGEAVRYRMLETIRQYAQERLLEAREAAQVRDLHLEHFVTFAEAMEKKLHTPAYLAIFEQLDIEVDNFRAALGWAQGSANHAKLAHGLRLGTALVEYWNYIGMAQEGYDWLSTGLAVPTEEERLLLIRAKAYIKAADLLGILAPIRQHYCAQSVALYRKSDDRPGLAFALVYYGYLLSLSPHPFESASGIALLEESVSLFKQVGDPWSWGWLYFTKGCIAATQKNYATQRKMLEKGKACFAQAGDIFLSETYNWTLVFCTINQGDYEAARKYGEDCLDFYRKINSKAMVAYSHAVSGVIAHFQEDFARAETCFLEALTLLDEMGVVSGMDVWTYRMLGGCVARLGQIQRARCILLKSQSLGRKLTNWDRIGDPSGDLAFVVWIASITESQGQLVLAARFLGAVEVILETFFKPLDDFDKREYERITGKLRVELEEAAFTAAWAEGRKLNLEQALAEALAFCSQETVENTNGV